MIVISLMMISLEGKWHVLRDQRLPSFNVLIRESAIDLIGVPEE